MIDQVLRFFSFKDVTVQLVLSGSILLGAASGVLGSFAVLRKRSLMGDALAHAALPGVCLAFLVTGTKSIFPFLIGATISGTVGVLVMQGVIKSRRIKPDAAIGIVLSVFFGIGIVLLTHIQRLPLGNQSGLDKFLFGQAASILPADLVAMGIIAVVILAGIILLFKEFRLLTFDPDFMKSLGYPVGLIDLLLMGLIILTVMVSLQAVGVILVAALLITPAAAARFWTHRLNTMVIFAGLFGAVSGFFGTFLSSLAPRVPTGPIMVLAVTFIFIISAVIAPQRGVLSRVLLHRRNKQRMSIEQFLRGCIELQELYRGKEDIGKEALASHLSMPLRKVSRLSHKAASRNLCQFDEKTVRLTDSGRNQGVNIVKTHRLWEHYLLYRTHLGADQVHRDADEIEHILPQETIQELEQILQREGIDTKKIVSIHPLE